MKRIAICCDGTWQRLDARFPTNVVRFAKAVPPEDPRDGTVQLAFHLDGVGTGRGTVRLAQFLDRALGGLTGLGLTEAVAEAYRLIVFSYKPGDQIYIFGFSRGAYTARSLAGMIRNCGIVERVYAERVVDALRLYRSPEPDDKPDGRNSYEFRANYAPAVVTGDAERAWRTENRPGDWSTCIDLRICYIGVWDTVGSLGVPAQLSPGGMLNRRHQFHDTSLSSRVLSARHAVAIDEQRRNFEPTLWDNIGELNGEDGCGPDAKYQQRWFPGVHGAVGGGGPDSALSSAALLWILEGAERQGLYIDPGVKARLAAETNPNGAIDAGTTPSLFTRLLRVGSRDRPNGPSTLDELSEPAIGRWRGDPDYRPRTLERVGPLIGRV